MFKKILLWFFAVLGVLFFCILVALTWFIIADPFNLRPIITMMLAATPSREEQTSPGQPDVVPKQTTEVSSDTGTGQAEAAVQTGDPIPMTDAQVQALDSVGLSASAISQEQESCFVRVLGQARVDEVKAGAVPTAAEFFSARDCL